MTAPDARPAAARLHVRVEGIVQGVGFRPFVAALAARLGVHGFVGNDTRGVFAEVEGPPTALAAFVEALSAEAPPLARVDHVGPSPMPATGGIGFRIVASDRSGSRDVLVAADAATCADCLAELWDPADRRYRYPFTNCTNCGPRLTIVRDTPYDRAMTTMAGFALCVRCQREYDDPLDRRFHAQPVCCPACGPQLRLLDAAGGQAAGRSGADPLQAAVAALRAGKIVAVKGLGGYHLAADATNESAVATLRARKHREERPFAVLVADVAAARAVGRLDTAAEKLLTGPARPIVLVRRRPDTALAPSVAPGQPTLGLLLPYTPLHHLLAADAGSPLVLTSGNVSDEPIAYRDDDAVRRLSGIADLVLAHDRPIQTRVDDSVVRAVRDRPLFVRRSRGYVPQPLTLPWGFPRHVLACGPELKNTFCLGRDRHAFVSHHIGDLENYETLGSFTDGIAHLGRLFDVAPEVVAHDLHPEYLSTKYAVDLDGVDLVGVQHHHAHIASCLADNGIDDRVIGVAFDGLGLGTDGTLWGGEFLLGDLIGFERAAHFDPVPMPGGAAAVREPWRMAASYLDAAYDGELCPPLAVAARQGRRWHDVLAAARAGVNAPMTSSAGRLFDAVSAVLGIRDAVSYEGQAAIELEHVADSRETGAYPAAVLEGPPLRVRGADLVRAVVDDVGAGTPVPVVAARFHNSLAQVVVDVCSRLRAATGLSTVALSGGVFQNVLLLERCMSGLEDSGFGVLTHARVPPNDGGISLGQAAVAGARDRAGFIAR